MYKKVADLWLVIGKSLCLITGSRSISPYNLDGLCGRMYENTVIEENKTIYVIYVGYYTLGELLSISIWGTNKTECEQTLDILKTIKR